MLCRRGIEMSRTITSAGAGGEIDQRTPIAGCADRFRTVTPTNAGRRPGVSTSVYIALWRQVRIVNEPCHAGTAYNQLADAKLPEFEQQRLFRLPRSAIIPRLARYWKWSATSDRISVGRFVR
jgi:hypothetical protein